MSLLQRGGGGKGESDREKAYEVFFLGGGGGGKGKFFNLQNSRDFRGCNHKHLNNQA